MILLWDFRDLLEKKLFRYLLKIVRKILFKRNFMQWEFCIRKERSGLTPNTRTSGDLSLRNRVSVSGRKISKRKYQV